MPQTILWLVGHIELWRGAHRTLARGTSLFHSCKFKLDLTSSSNRHLPDPDLVVAVSSEQSLTISRPGHGQALGGVSARRSRNLRSQFLDHVLGLEIPNLDGWSGGGAQPVPVGREGEPVDGVVMVQGVEMLAIIEIPQHSLGVLSS